MAASGDQIDLERLGLKSGGGWHGELPVSARQFVFGDQQYRPDTSCFPVRIDVSRTTSGYVVRARATATVVGPCMRCFDDQGFTVAIDQSEVHEPQLELDSDYVGDAGFDVAAFVNDAIGLALPQTMSGELDTEGSCRLCGRSREQLHQIGIADDLDAGGQDPRWAKLRELEL